MVEVIYHGVVGGGVARIAVRFDCGNACAVLVPFMSPEVVVVAVNTEPVCFHEVD